ncbi:MAG: polysaccharide biosynthesis protein [Clostridia bacterium]|nr:polysaccharide biosynthesis protein [Clostridia bacterium]
MKKQSFIFGALILSVSGIICKILGAFYKIPLANILGAQGIGIYYLIFPVYALFITFVSSSFTISISKSVTNAVAKNECNYAHRIFCASLILLFFIGLGISILLCVLCKAISTLQGFDNAFVCYLIVAPAIVAVAVSSAFRGFFQGLHNMTPSAVSQVINQIFKLATGFLLARLLIGNGVLFGTAGAILGITIAEVLTCIYFVCVYFVFKKRNKKFFVKDENSKMEKLTCVMKSVFKQSIPFTLSSIILPMSLVIDSFLILNILKSMGFEKLFSTGLMGLNSGVVNALINLPSTLSVAVCMTIVPYISFAMSKKDYVGVKSKASLALKLTMLISLPCCIIFSVFSKEIITTLYAGSLQSVYEINVASSLLTISSINIFYLAILQLSTAFLQAINKSYVPVFSLSIGLVFKVVFEVIFISNPYMNISGAVVSNSACYFVACLVNIIYFKKEFRITYSFFKIVICPLIASVVATFCIFLSLKIVQEFFSISVCTVLSLILGILIYIFLIFVLKTFTKEEKDAIFLSKFRKKRT